MQRVREFKCQKIVMAVNSCYTVNARLDNINKSMFIQYLFINYLVFHYFVIFMCMVFISRLCIKIPPGTFEPS